MRADLHNARALLADAEQLLELGDTMAHSELAADRAEVELSGGDANAVISNARIALTMHHAHGTRYHEARAGILLAAGHVVAGGRGNQVIAAQALDTATTLAEIGGYDYLTARSALVRAAIANHDGDRARADALLRREVTRRYTKGGGLVIVLKSALQHRAEANLMPGPTAYLRALGLLPETIDIVLVVERSAGRISTTTGRSVAGRNLLCELLARLIESSGRPVTAEDLYRSVWGAEYHPLRHRNTLYSAISRLRRVLSQLVPDQGELVETTRDGWYLRAAGRVTS
jgi:DNA-binding response OmpR family regulator